MSASRSFVADKLGWQKALISDHSLSAVTRLVGCQVMHDLHAERRGAWRSQESIAALVGVDVRTVRRCLAALVAAGYLRMTASRGRGHTNFYEAIFSTASATEDVAPAAAPHKADLASEKRAPAPEKPDTRVLPYLEKQTHTPLTPDRRAKATSNGSHFTRHFRPTARRRLAGGAHAACSPSS